MASEVDYHCKAEALLSQAAAAPNMLERGRLIDEAMYWHMLALEAAKDAGGRDAPHDAPDDAQDEGLAGEV
jgi:hypothetical protein